MPSSPARRDAGGYSGSEVRAPLPAVDGGVFTTARSTGFGAAGGGAATGRSLVALEMAVVGPVSIARSIAISGGGTYGGGCSMSGGGGGGSLSSSGSSSMIFVGTQEEKAKQQLAEKTNPVPARAAVATGIGGFETLEVFEPFDRAWRRVGLALDRVGFTVEDRDRQKGQYFVRYADADAEMNRKDGEKPGLLSKLAFWKPSEPAVKAEQYRVHIRQFAGKSVVQILNKDGAPASSQTVKRIVSLLHEQLK